MTVIFTITPQHHQFHNPFTITFIITGHPHLTFHFLQPFLPFHLSLSPLLSTFSHIPAVTPTGKQLLHCFSLTQNWTRLMSHSTAETHLQTLDGIR